MADPMDPSPAPQEPRIEPPKPAAGAQAMWPLAALAAVALLAVCGLALGLVLILGRNAAPGGAGQSVQVNPVINVANPAAAPAAPPQAPAPASAPSGPRRGEAPTA